MFLPIKAAGTVPIWIICYNSIIYIFASLLKSVKQLYTFVKKRKKAGHRVPKTTRMAGQYDTTQDYISFNEMAKPPARASFMVMTVSALTVCVEI